MNTQLNLANLHKLDGGKADRAVSHAIRQCVADITDRPGDKSKRKVSVVISLEPKLDRDLAALEDVAVDIQINTGIPKRQTRQYPMALGPTAPWCFPRPTRTTPGR
jgi:hypothetical protein